MLIHATYCLLMDIWIIQPFSDCELCFQECEQANICVPVFNSFGLVFRSGVVGLYTKLHI